MADSVTEYVLALDPELPPSITDRAADMWEPLITVADTAGGHWPESARRAALELLQPDNISKVSLGLRLLQDVRGVLGNRSSIYTEELLDRLLALDEGPWEDLSGRPLDPRRLAALLNPYGVKPLQIRNGQQKRRGYILTGEHGLQDPFNRYLETVEDVASP